MEILKAIIFGIIEGITEWMPISSTAHMDILNRILPLRVWPISSIKQNLPQPLTEIISFSLMRAAQFVTILPLTNTCPDCTSS